PSVTFLSDERIIRGGLLKMFLTCTEVRVVALAQVQKHALNECYCDFSPNGRASQFPDCPTMRKLNADFSSIHAGLWWQSVWGLSARIYCCNCCNQSITIVCS